MEEKNSKAPEFLPIKGYRYRKKMIAAAAVILLLIIALIVSGIHLLVSSLTKGKNSGAEGGNGTDSHVSEVLMEYTNPSTDSEISPNDDVTPGSKELVFDGEKLEIDTDTLDGKKAVAITFDDGPGKFTKRLLDELDSRNVKATFFMVGSCVEQYPEVLPQMVSSGHQLGNHTYNHTDITSISIDEMTDQISRTDNAIYNACGQISTAFRPPYGAYNQYTNSAIDKTITLWSVDTLDWKLESAEEVKDSIVSQCKDGAIILLHDIHENSVNGAISAIDVLLEQGYVFVTVDELLERYGYEIEKGQAHSSQFAVYETTSPYAEKYLQELYAQMAEEEEKREKEESAANNEAEDEQYEQYEDYVENDKPNENEDINDNTPSGTNSKRRRSSTTEE